MNDYSFQHANNYQNYLKSASLQRKKLHWPRLTLIWPTGVYIKGTCMDLSSALDDKYNCPQGAQTWITQHHACLYTMV